MLKIELTFFRFEVYGSIVKDSTSRQKALGSIRAHTCTPTSFLYLLSLLRIHTCVHTYIHAEREEWIGEEGKQKRRGGKERRVERIKFL